MTTDQLRRGWLAAIRACLPAAGLIFSLAAFAAVDVFLTGVPDYQWHAGCSGTACGNLMGYWDRHGFPNFYTGPTAGGVAPLDSYGDNHDIRSLWASKAGQDGRPAGLPGHEDDYYIEYESTAPDPYWTFGRPEHSPDCIGDFIGLNQRKWKNLNGECDGNIDGYSFIYWDPSGERRLNFTPGPEAGLPPVDVQSGLRAWASYRGCVADVFSQLSEFSPDLPQGRGFTFDDLRAEIDAGYPVLLSMQSYITKYRRLPGMDRANPQIHAMLAYGYYIDDEGTQFVRYRTSWATGDYDLSPWSGENWTPQGTLNLPLRGVVGFHPRPRITDIAFDGKQLVLRWEGPEAELRDNVNDTLTQLHWYVVEKADGLGRGGFAFVSSPVTRHELSLSIDSPATAFYRVKLLPVQKR